MGKISGTANMRGDGESKVTVALETLCVINIKPDSTHLEKRSDFSIKCLNLNIAHFQDFILLKFMKKVFKFCCFCTKVLIKIDTTSVNFSLRKDSGDCMVIVDSLSDLLFTPE